MEARASAHEHLSDERHRENLDRFTSLGNEIDALRADVVKSADRINTRISNLTLFVAGSVIAAMGNLVVMLVAEVLHLKL